MSFVSMAASFYVPGQRQASELGLMSALALDQVEVAKLVFFFRFSLCAPIKQPLLSALLL